MMANSIAELLTLHSHIAFRNLLISFFFFFFFFDFQDQDNHNGELALKIWNLSRWSFFAFETLRTSPCNINNYDIQ